MIPGKPDNAARRLLRMLGVTLYRAGLSKLVVRMRPRRIRATLYHSIEANTSPFTNGLNGSVTPETFAANLDYFKAHYNVLPMKRLEQGDLPPRPMFITFDDGYRSVFEHAIPALHERDMSACVYLITRATQGKIVWVNLLNYALREYPEQSRRAMADFTELPLQGSAASIIGAVRQRLSPDRIAALCDNLEQALPSIDFDGLYATDADILAAQEKGFHFGFHTRDHVNLKNCSETQLLQELDSSGCDHLINSNTFAYPFGDFNQGVVTHLDRKDYQRVMTVGNNNDRFSAKHLDRAEVFSADPADVFAQLEVVEPVIAMARKWLLKVRPDKTPTNSSVAAISPDQSA